MEHGKALAIKGVMTIVVLFLIMGFGYGAGFGDVLIMTLVLGLVSYVLGDLFFLPRTSNIMASLADFGLAFILIWGLGTVLMEPTQSLIWGALFSALLIAGGEWFFHSYMKENVLHARNGA